MAGTLASQGLSIADAYSQNPDYCAKLVKRPAPATASLRLLRAYSKTREGLADLQEQATGGSLQAVAISPTGTPPLPATAVPLKTKKVTLLLDFQSLLNASLFSAAFPWSAWLIYICSSVCIMWNLAPMSSRYVVYSIAGWGVFRAAADPLMASQCVSQAVWGAVRYTWWWSSCFAYQTASSAVVDSTFAVAMASSKTVEHTTGIKVSPEMCMMCGVNVATLGFFAWWVRRHA